MDHLKSNIAPVEFVHIRRYLEMIIIGGAYIRFPSKHVPRVWRKTFWMTGLVRVREKPGSP